MFLDLKGGFSTIATTTPKRFLTLCCSCTSTNVPIFSLSSYWYVSGSKGDFKSAIS